MNIPGHVAVIMDGNGRWAKQKGLTRADGHKEGAQSVEAVVTRARQLGIRVLTLYVFSTENWKRPVSEVMGLMQLFIGALNDKQKLFTDNNIKLMASGRRSGVEDKVIKALDSVINLTAKNDAMVLNLAFNYGSRQEITDAVNALIKEGKKEITPEDISGHLYTKGLPDPDLIIRTSGEKRLSNFLLWQSAYSELIFTDVLWPDFREEHLDLAIKEYNSRKRRFGGI